MTNCPRNSQLSPDSPEMRMVSPDYLEMRMVSPAYLSPDYLVSPDYRNAYGVSGLPNGQPRVRAPCRGTRSARPLWTSRPSVPREMTGRSSRERPTLGQRRAAEAEEVVPDAGVVAMTRGHPQLVSRVVVGTAPGDVAQA